MTCEIFAFPADRCIKAAARNKLQGRTEEDFRAKARPLRASDLPSIPSTAGSEYAEARLREAARVYVDTFGPTAAAVVFGELIGAVRAQERA